MPSAAEFRMLQRVRVTNPDSYMHEWEGYIAHLTTEEAHVKLDNQIMSIRFRFEEITPL